MRALLTVFVFTLVAVSGLRAAGESEVLFVSSGSAEVGGETTVTLAVAELADPPLGAWQIDISDDNTVVTATECIGLAGSVCNHVFDEHTVRVAGASASGLTGTNELGTIAFVCDRLGESPLMLRLSIWGNAFGTDQRKVELEEGTITCTEPPDLVTISSLELVVGEQGIVFVEAQRVAQPGVGSWGVELTFDLGHVNLIACNALGEGGHCAGDPQKSSVQGSTADGLQAGTILAEFTFRCRGPGESEIGASVWIWSVAEVGLDERPVEVVPGRITCSSALPAELPSTGVAEPPPASPPAAVPLAVLGAALVSAAIAARRYASLR